MSTRGCIARLLRKDPLEFEGVYHHWDSYPSGLGRALFHLRRGFFREDTDAMLRMLIDQHPAGWSVVVGARFDLTPGFRDRSKSEETDDRPQCYCHGDRHSPGWTVTQQNAGDSGIEYAYVFDGRKMLVAGSFCRSGDKMVGMFGMGDPDAVWSVIAEVDLDGPEPDWEKLDEAS